MLRQRDLRRDFVKLHLDHAQRFVVERGDNAGLNRIVCFAIGNNRWRGADGAKHPGLNRRTHDAHRQALQLGHVAHRLVGDEIAHAAAGESDQHDVRFLRHLIDNGFEHIGREHFVPMIVIAKQERQVQKRCSPREGRHVGWRSDGIVDGYTLAHVRKIILLQPEFTVSMQDKINRLAIVFFH